MNRAPTRARRVVVLVLGWALVAAAISVLITLDLGVAPYDVLNVGVGKLLGVATGTAMWVTGAVLVTAAWLLGVRPGPATPAGFVTIGMLINVFLNLLPNAVSGAAVIPLLVVAVAVLYAGVCFIVVSGYGAGPTEVFMLALHRRGAGLRVSRWVIEIGCAGLGWMLGGPVGPLTVLLVAVAAPLIAFLLPTAGRVLGPVAAPADI